MDPVALFPKGCRVSSLNNNANSLSNIATLGLQLYQPGAYRNLYWVCEGQGPMDPSSQTR